MCPPSSQVQSFKYKHVNMPHANAQCAPRQVKSSRVVQTNMSTCHTRIHIRTTFINNKTHTPPNYNKIIDSKQQQTYIKQQHQNISFCFCVHMYAQSYNNAQYQQSTKQNARQYQAQRRTKHVTTSLNISTYLHIYIYSIHFTDNIIYSSTLLYITTIRRQQHNTLPFFTIQYKLNSIQSHSCLSPTYILFKNKIKTKQNKHTYTQTHI